MKPLSKADNNYLSNLKYDLPAGLVVFLVALPLCLGISLASGAPLFSGLIAGICGGLIVASMSGSHLSVSGPAAGLATIVASAITDVGFDAFLVSVVIAGILQIFFGYLKAGVVGYYFPSSVIKGMLAAIGILLILKQIPHAIGYDKDPQGDESYWQPDGENTFTELFKVLQFIHPGAAIIAIVSLGILILWERPFIKKQVWSTWIPGALLVVIGGALMNEIFRSSYPHFTIEMEHMVNLPTITSFQQAKDIIIIPKFSSILEVKVLITGIIIAVVASLETLLSVEAVDKLDPQRRRTPANRELIAQGFGNAVSGMLGGLPITSVIVRSSANLNAGAKTKLSALTHGVLLLVAVLLIPSLLNKIPYASLAAILLVTGYKLAKIPLFRAMYRLGWAQFMPFVITIVAILRTDLLKGIGVGMLAFIFYILRSNYRMTYVNEEKHPSHGPIYIELGDAVTFLNKGKISHTLKQLPANSEVTIDASRTTYIDHDVLEIIQNFKNKAPENGIKLHLINIPEVELIGGH